MQWSPVSVGCSATDRGLGSGVSHMCLWGARYNQGARVWS